MRTFLINEENIDEYAQYLDEDTAENIGRIFYRAIVAEDPSVPENGGALVWRFKNMDSDKPCEAVIEWLCAETKEAAVVLLAAYKEEIEKQSVSRSFIELNVSQGRKFKDVLKEAGFSFKLFEGDRLVCTIAEMKKMPIFNMNIPMDGVYPLSEMRMRAFRKEILRCVDAGRCGVCEDLSYLPMSYFESDISSYIEIDGEVLGMHLYHKNPSGSLEIDLLIAWGKDFKMIFAQLFKQTLMSAVELYPDETKVILNRHNEAALLLTEKMFPRGLGSPIYTGERIEIQ